MPSHPTIPSPRGGRHGRQIRPCLLQLEPRVVPSLTFPGIAGVTFDTSGDIFVSYDSSTENSGQQQSVAEVGANGFGTVASGSLEQANVDITEELVALIQAQRNFQANAKAIDTANQMTQTVVNLRN